MALDTPNKRLAAFDPMCPWRRALPFPDGTSNEGDRRQTMYLARQPGEAVGGGGHFYKQIHHRSGKHPHLAQSDVPQLYMKIG